MKRHRRSGKRKNAKYGNMPSHRDCKLQRQRTRHAMSVEATALASNYGSIMRGNRKRNLDPVLASLMSPGHA